MVISDIGQDMIALCLRISVGTLRKYYRRELDTSYAIIVAEMGGKVVTRARAGDDKMLKFFLETHGWVLSERLVVADGGVDNATALSDAEIEARLTRLNRKAARKGGKA